MSVKPSVYRAQPGSKPASRTAPTSVRNLWATIRLLLIPSILSIVGMLMVILVPTGTIQWHWNDLWMSFLFIGLLYGIHVWLNITKPRADQVILPVVGVIMALGLVMMQRLEPSLA